MKSKLLKNFKRWSTLKYFKTFNCYKNLSDIEKPIEIKLISSEGKEFRIDAKIAEYSQYIAKRLNDPKVERDGIIVIKLDISFLIFFSTFYRPITSLIIKQSLRRLNHLMVPFPIVTQEIHIFAISKQFSGHIEFVFGYNSL